MRLQLAFPTSFWVLVAIGVVALGGGRDAKADELTCGPLRNAFGPFDYRIASVDDKAVVENRHFTRKVERLQAGETGLIGQDIDYTLRVFPNHSRALMSMSRLAVRERKPRPPGAGFTIDCYFDRAFRLAPSDPMPNVLFGLYLTRVERNSEAAPYFDRGAELAGGDPNVHYNLGLGYLDLGMHDKALTHARAAYAAGFPLPGLRDRLKQAGAWKE
jgi:hypothetical protein